MSSKQKTSQSSVSDTTNTANPADWAAQNYHTGASDALNAYESGQGSQVYQGERVPGQLSGQTQAGQGILSQAAQNLANQGPLAQGALTKIANADPGQTNPYFEQQLNNTLSNVSNQVSNSAAAQGTSSAAQNQQLGTAMGQAATSALSDQYNKGVEQQMGASGLLNQEQQGYNNTLGNLANSSIKAGMLTTGLQQLQDAAKQQMFNEQQMQPWKRLGLLGAATNTFAAPYGTATTHATGSSKGTGSVGMGGALMSGLAGLLAGGGIL